MADTQPTNEQSKKELILLIVQYLQNEANTSNLDENQTESLSVAIDCLKQTYKIETQEPSAKLLNIYESSKSGSLNVQDLVSTLRQFAPSILPALTPFISQLGDAALRNVYPSSSNEPTATSQSAPTQQQQSAPVTRKNASDEDKQKAEALKNQGNELMKNDQFKQAYDCYAKAIELDNNNAVYYSNRAAALSKLNDHHGALKDCNEAIQIDPTYSKAYGRLGLAYVSLNDHAKARDAYKEAVRLDPTNESYKNNLALATQKANESQTGTSGNPIMDLLGQVTQGGSLDNLMQSPDLQNAYNMFCNIVSAGQQQQQRQQPPPGSS